MSTNPPTPQRTEGGQTPESIADAIRPTLDLFTQHAEPFVRKAADSLYEALLNDVQDYLRENGEWNIGQEIERCRRIDAENATLRATVDELIGALEPFTRTNPHKNEDGLSEVLIGCTVADIRRARTALSAAKGD